MRARSPGWASPRMPAPSGKPPQPSLRARRADVRWSTLPRRKVRSPRGWRATRSCRIGPALPRLPRLPLILLVTERFCWRGARRWSRFPVMKAQAKALSTRGKQGIDMTEPESPAVEPTTSDIRLVIAASSMGTIFEWYDFFIYGTLAAIIGKTFFPAGNETLQLLLVWAGFAVGFGFRPLGAILFGFLGDRLGRKYTFLVTVTLMGLATAGVGMIPSAASIGFAAPLLVLGLRILQGLALGGEYGGAAIYVSEHSPPERRGYFTSFIQASVVGGFVLSLIVVLSCKGLMSAPTWAAWGWRIPFLLSLALLAVSLWMRLKLSESPVFRAMQEE